jgi:hypothetical protein
MRQREDEPSSLAGSTPQQEKGHQCESNVGGSGAFNASFPEDTGVWSLGKASYVSRIHYATLPPPHLHLHIVHQQTLPILTKRSQTSFGTAEGPPLHAHPCHLHLLTTFQRIHSTAQVLVFMRNCRSERADCQQFDIIDDVAVSCKAP